MLQATHGVKPMALYYRALSTAQEAFTTCLCRVSVSRLPTTSCVAAA